MADHERTEAEIDLLARLAALEHLVKHLLWNIAVLVVDQDGGDEDDAAKEVRGFAGNVRDELSRAALPGLDPALSDHVAAQTEAHVERVLQELLREMARERGGP